VATGLDTEKANSAIKEGYAALERFGSQRARNWTIAIVAIIAFSLWAVWRDGWDLFFQRVVDALNNGFIYAAMALSLVLIYKATGVINFAQGNMAMFGTFIAWVFISDHGFPVWLGVAVAMLLSAVGGAAIERIFIRPSTPATTWPHDVTLAWFTASARSHRHMGRGSVRLRHAVPPQQLLRLRGARFFYENPAWADPVTLPSSLLLEDQDRPAPVGVSNLESSRLVGIHIGRTIQFGWALAAAVGTLAGCLIAHKSYLTPLHGAADLLSPPPRSEDWTASVTIALATSRVAETMIGGYIDPIGSDLALGGALLVIVVVLFVKPTGLFGSRKPERV
jgi:branched-chain amino acid transport system permease protein